MNYFADFEQNGTNIGGFLQLKADQFCTTIFDATSEWLSSIESDNEVMKKIGSLAKLKSAGDRIAGGTIQVD